MSLIRKRIVHSNIKSPIMIKSVGSRLLRRSAEAAGSTGRSHPRATESVLLRDWINDSLYNPKKGYFQKKASIIQQRRSKQELVSLFRSFKNREAYVDWLKDWYRNQTDGNAWRTPSELFGPLYAEPIAKLILQLYPRFKGKPLRIIEFGPGRGATCSNILDYFKSKMPLIYASLTYECVEISSSFAEALESSVVRNHPRRVKVTQASALEYEGFATQDPCIIIGLELLDNLTHDRILIHPDGKIDETWVSTRRTQRGMLSEFTARPLEDTTIKSVLHIVSPTNTQYSEVYVPTGSYKLLEHLGRVAPNAALVFSDFDYFPGRDPTLSDQETIKNEPAVHATIEGKTKNYRSMLRAPYGADIYFPTDFSDFEKIYLHFNPTAKATSLKNSDFFRRYADDLTLKACRTMDGYSPILSDYDNTSFFLTLPEVLQQQQQQQKTLAPQKR